LIGVGVIVAFVQGRRTPTGNPQYVALGSSFAAGAGLGPLQEGSPLLCARSVGGYPNRLAAALKLDLVDMACGGAVTRHLLDGGQYFQGPQIRVVDRHTRLVTITVGGNDTLYIADLSQLAASHDSTLWGWLVRQFWTGPRSLRDREYARFEQQLTATIRAVRNRAPQATIVVATYPTILPPEGTCDAIGLTAPEAELMRTAGDNLAQSTTAAAKAEGATVVDMHRLGAAHHACSARPWTNGWKNGGIAPFHPTRVGASATAAAIARALKASPAGVAAVDQHDASGHEAGGIGRQEQRH
jgi:lysophospholipase L1-like esterase